MNDNATRMVIDDPDAPASVESQQSNAAEPQVGTPFVLVTRDLPWPDDTDMRFTVELPQPAIFRRAYRTEVHHKIMNKRIWVLRMVWLAREDGPKRRLAVALQSMQDVVELTDTDADPVALELVIGPMGLPFQLWQMAQLREAPEPPPRA